MSKHAKTILLVETARKILEAGHPMTVRQVYYQLVSRLVVENNRGQYQSVSNALVDARKEGVIPWNWIEDRLRRPRHVSMWDGLPDFAETCSTSYRRDVWATQPHYVEVWLEKDALSGIFEDALDPYGVTLNVGRGYDGWASIKNAADRYADREVETTILYFGDFDPSGEDMPHSLQKRLGILGSTAAVIKCALTHDDILRHTLPHNATKDGDTRSKGFVAQHGDEPVELDALPTDVLRTMLIEEVSRRMDLDALQTIKDIEDKERDQLMTALQHEARP